MGRIGRSSEGSDDESSSTAAGSSRPSQGRRPRMNPFAPQRAADDVRLGGQPPAAPVPPTAFGATQPRPPMFRSHAAQHDPLGEAPPVGVAPSYEPTQETPVSQTNPSAKEGVNEAPGEPTPAPVFSAEDYQVNPVPPSGAGVVATNVDVWSSSPEFELPPDGVDTVGELRVQLEALRRSVDTLANRPSVESIEPEFIGASKTLRYAQQTADSILEDARNEAAELVADAERQRSDIIRQAREQAERDYGAERDRVRAEAAAWESRRADLVSEIASLSAVIGRYHDGLRGLEDRLDLAAESLNNGHPGGSSEPTHSEPADPEQEPPESGSATATF